MAESRRDLAGAFIRLFESDHAPAATRDSFDPDAVGAAGSFAPSERREHGRGGASVVGRMGRRACDYGESAAGGFGGGAPVGVVWGGGGCGGTGGEFSIFLWLWGGGGGAFIFC